MQGGCHDWAREVSRRSVDGERRRMGLMARVFLVSIWLAAAGMTGVLGFIGYELSRSPRATAVPMSIERLPSRQIRNPWARWSVTEHLSAHRVLIAHVETEFLGEAVAITQQIVEPVKGAVRRSAHVLPPPRPSRHAARRGACSGRRHAGT